ncbi:hypothetical protein XENOCAPTIV_026566, partial [Xenoophorus captivus]
AVRVIMTLLPHVFAPEDPQLSMEVQFSLAHHILAMVKSERNRQIMCEGGLVSTLLTQCRSMLLSPNHHLHQPVMRIFEKLSSQAISHSEFRLDAVCFWGSIFEGFPPTAGLSFTCWFQINRFSSACDSHPIRLLSVVRHMSRTEQQYICLSLSFSAYDGCLVISTEEEAFTFLDMMEPEVCSPTSLSSSLRFRCSSMLVPGQWHHLAVVMAKDVKKSCMTSAYFNGKACLCPGPDPNAETFPLRLVPEERISFGINPAISTLTTVVQIREDYNEVDCRLIAKEVSEHSSPALLPGVFCMLLLAFLLKMKSSFVGHRTFQLVICLSSSANLHPSTLKLGLVLLTQFLSDPGQQRAFREGVIPGTLIEGIEEPFVIMGFDVLQELLVRHTHLPQVYASLSALLLGRNTSHTTEGEPFSGDKCDSDAPWEVQLPASVMQFLCLLHNLRPRDSLWASPKFLRSLASVVYPVEIPETVGKADTQREKTVSALYSCTNKVLLYFLSQPRRSQEEKEVVTRALQTFMERWDVFMATYNANVNFITCLLHCLLLIRSGR